MAPAGLISVNPNSHFDPTKQLVLNPAAWADAPGGQFGDELFLTTTTSAGSGSRRNR